MVVLLSEHVPHLSLEIWLCLELGCNLVTEVAISQVLPPVLGENVLLFSSHLGMLGNNIFCLNDGRIPDLTLVVLEVDFLSALSLEVEVEPFQEFSGKDQKVCEVVMVQRSVDDKQDVFVCESDVTF